MMVTIFGLGAAVVTQGLAAEEGKMPVGRSSGTGEMTQAWNVQLTTSYLPATDIHGSAADVSIFDNRLKIIRNIGMDDRLSLSVGGGYGLKHLDASPAASLPQDLHSLYLEAGVRYRINDRSYASLKLFPGLYGDFNEIGTDELRMPVLALGGYRFENGISLVGGFIYRFGYHATQFIPALGLSYQPDHNWRVDLIVPRPGVTYIASRQLQLFAGGDIASDEYEIKERSVGARALKYSDYKVLVGVDYIPRPAVKISTSLGYAFERKIVFFDGNRPDLRMDGIPFVKVSLDMGW
jgi:hypothetical protein